MIDLGISKLALIGAVALIVIGPEKLPRVARTVGTLLGKAQRYVSDVKAEVNRSMELDELKKMKDTVESAAAMSSSPSRPAPADFEKSWAEATDTASTAVGLPLSVPARRCPSTGTPRKTGASSRVPRPTGTRPANGRAYQGLSGAARVARLSPAPNSTDVRFPMNKPRRRTGRHRAALCRAPGGAARPAGQGRHRRWRGGDCAAGHLSGARPRCTTCWPRRWWRTCPRAPR